MTIPNQMEQMQMEAQKPKVRTSDIRHTIKELVAMGCVVDWNTTTGAVRFEPPAAGQPRGDQFDMVDFRG